MCVYEVKLFFACLVYRERPVINTGTVSIDYLQSLPQGSFGREYAEWLHVNVCSSAYYFITELVLVDNLKYSFVIFKYCYGMTHFKVHNRLAVYQFHQFQHL